MSRIEIPPLDNVPEPSRPVLAAVNAQLGMVPNLFRLMAISPRVLAAFTGFSGELAKTLDLKTRERIALAIAQVNGCDYCLSAHTYLALNLAKLSPAEVELNRQGGSEDAKADAAVGFAARLVSERGRVSDADLAEVRSAGFTDAQIVEIVAVVAENLFTNFLNMAAGTDIDFPVVVARELA